MLFFYCRAEFQPGYWLNKFMWELMGLVEGLFPMNTLVLRHMGSQYLKEWEDFDAELRQSMMLATPPPTPQANPSPSASTEVKKQPLTYADVVKGMSSPISSGASSPSSSSIKLQLRKKTNPSGKRQLPLLLLCHIFLYILQ